MKTQIKIEGMSCEHCAKHVREALTKLSGVTTAKVDLHAHSAEITHADDITEAILSEAIDEAGYKLTELTLLSDV